MNYQRGQLPRYVCNVPVNLTLKDLDTGQSISRDQVSQVLANLANGEPERSRGIWDKLLLENADDVVHVLSLKGLFLYLSPSSRRILEYDPKELVGTALSAVCHPSDIVPVTRELKDASTGAAVSVVFRIRRKNSGYTWFECHGSLHTEQGKGKKCMVLVGRERPIYALNRKVIDNAGGIGEGEMWTKMSTSGMFLYVSPSAKAVLDRHPDELVGTSAQALMRNESKVEFGRALEIARTGVETTFKHDIHHKRGQNVHALTTIYPGDATRGQKPTFFVAQTRFPKMPRSLPASKPVETCSSRSDQASVGSNTPSTNRSGGTQVMNQAATPQSSGSNRLDGIVARAGGSGLAIGTQHEAVASVDNVFEELKTTRSTSWQFELRQMERRNRLLAEELHGLNQSKKKRKRRRGLGQLQKDCANCHAKSTPEWRRGPSGERDLCNSCGLRWAKQVGIAFFHTSAPHRLTQSHPSAVDPPTVHPAAPLHPPPSPRCIPRPNPRPERPHLAAHVARHERRPDEPSHNAPAQLARPLAHPFADPLAHPPGPPIRPCPRAGCFDPTGPSRRERGSAEPWNGARAACRDSTRGGIQSVGIRRRASCRDRRGGRAGRGGCIAGGGAWRNGGGEGAEAGGGDEESG
jgi:PAS domain S-box-containing protein